MCLAKMTQARRPANTAIRIRKNTVPCGSSIWLTSQGPRRMCTSRGTDQRETYSLPRDHALPHPAERWRWDLNPRRGCPLTRFRGVRPRPLGDSTAGELTIRAGLPALAEELAEQPRTFAGEHPAQHFGGVREPGVPDHVPE